MHKKEAILSSKFTLTIIYILLIIINLSCASLNKTKYIITTKKQSDGSWLIVNDSTFKITGQEFFLDENGMLEINILNKSTNTYYIHGIEAKLINLQFSDTLQPTEITLSNINTNSFDEKIDTIVSKFNQINPEMRILNSPAFEKKLNYDFKFNLHPTFYKAEHIALLFKIAFSHNNKSALLYTKTYIFRKEQSKLFSKILKY